jgi:N-acyl-D-aspartate/D-glutamate deacylase
MVELALRNATIVDGTGRARYIGDVGIGNGKITALGKLEGRASEEIDVGGAVVSPGFIDCHTHYDAQINWDDMLSPSVYHGVTTVLAGNCGFTLAPLSGRKEDVAYLLGMMSNVEGMPHAALKQAVKPSWQKFGEFLDHFDGKIAINTAFMVGHCALRRYVMGDRAVGHEATAEEIRDMTELLRESLAAGGTGFSTTTSISHSDHNGEAVPSRWATKEELLALARTVRAFPGTWIEMVPGFGVFGEKECELVTELSLAAQRPLNWNAIFVNSRQRDVLESQLAMGRYAHDHGAKVFALTPAVPIKGILNFRTGFSFDMLDGWKEFLRKPVNEKLVAMKDPAVRARLKQGAENPNNRTAALKDLEHYRIEGVRSQKNKRWQQRPLAQYAAEVGLSLFDALFNLAVEEDLWLTFSAPAFGSDEASWQLRKEVWADQYVLFGGSDAGAHLDLFNTFALTTQLLGEGVRERRILTLEEGVKGITSVLADSFGLKDRGRIQLGAAADLVVFDPETIGCGEISMRNDLPGGESRLYADAIGIHHVIVNGVPVAEGNKPTGRKGGKILRSGRDTYTVSLN